MRCIEVHGIIRKDTPLRYRNEFKGSAVFEYPPALGKKNEEKPIEFCVERSALGNVAVSVRLLEDIDYPVLPVIKSLKEHIFDLDKKGLLP